MKSVLRIVGMLFVLLVVLVGCAAGPNDFLGTADTEGDVAGFLDGLWHGVIAPVTFVISLFSDQTSMYDVHNNGGWYDFGFLLGASVILGGSGSGARGKKRK